MGYGLLDGRPAGRGMHQGTLAVLDGRIIVTRAQEVVGHAVGDSPELSLIVQLLGEDCGLAEIVEAPLGVSKRKEGTVKGDAELDALGEEVVLHGETLGSAQRLLEVSHGFAVGCTRYGLFLRLPAVH